MSESGTEHYRDKMETTFDGDEMISAPYNPSSTGIPRVVCQNSFADKTWMHKSDQECREICLIACGDGRLPKCASNSALIGCLLEVETEYRMEVIFSGVNEGRDETRTVQYMIPNKLSGAESWSNARGMTLSMSLNLHDELLAWLRGKKSESPEGPEKSAVQNDEGTKQIKERGSIAAVAREEGGDANYRRQDRETVQRALNCAVHLIREDEQTTNRSQESKAVAAYPEVPCRLFDDMLHMTIESQAIDTRSFFVSPLSDLLLNLVISVDSDSDETNRTMTMHDTCQDSDCRSIVKDVAAISLSRQDHERRTKTAKNAHRATESGAVRSESLGMGFSVLVTDQLPYQVADQCKVPEACAQCVNLPDCDWCLWQKPETTDEWMLPASVPDFARVNERYVRGLGSCGVHPKVCMQTTGVVNTCSASSSIFRVPLAVFLPAILLLTWFL